MRRRPKSSIEGMFNIFLRHKHAFKQNVQKKVYICKTSASDCAAHQSLNA